MNTTSRARRIAFFALSSFATILTFTSQAHAFCGFFVSEAGTPLYNDATQVVLMRYETQTVLSMRNNYKGPPEDFAMVVPVPQVLQEEDVKTLPDKLFDRLEKYSAPRLVEYWQEDPCARARRLKSLKKLDRSGVKTVQKSGGAVTRYPIHVRVRWSV